MRRAVGRFARSAIDAIVGPVERTRAGRSALGRFVERAVERCRRVTYNGVTLTFAVPNRLSEFRVETFATKEPETLAWLDALPRGCVLWDVGANVGLYTCYAAVARDCRVYAFEPSVFNVEWLARNIFLNGVSGRVTIVPLALSDRVRTSTLNMSSTEWGGALSTFDEVFGYDGRPLSKRFEFSTLGVSMDAAVERLGIAAPQYLKIDVDGIEHLILRDAAAVLSRVDGVLIEVNDEFETQRRETAEQLERAGLVMVEKRHAPQFDGSAFAHSYNQIWRRRQT